MPTHLEELAADRDRLRRALSGLTAEQEAVVRRLEEDLALARNRMDRVVLRLLLMGRQYGHGSADATLARREAEEANTEMIDTTKKLERQQMTLEYFRKRLSEVEAGGTISVNEPDQTTADG